MDIKVLTVVVVFLAGMLFEWLIDYLQTRIQSGSGTLKIDHSNPEKDVYRIEFDGDPEELSNKKYYILNIDHNADLSHD